MALEDDVLQRAAENISASRSAALENQPPAEQVIDPIAATPVAQAPTTPAEVTDIDADVPEYMRTLYAEQTAPTEAAAVVPTTPAAEYKIPAEVQAKLDELERYKTNPLVSKAIEFGNSGEADPNKFFEAVTGLDHKQFSDAQLKEAYLKNQEGITEDEVQAEMDDFNRLPAWKQIAEMKPFRQSMEAEKEAKLKSVSFTPQSNPDREVYAAASKAADEALPKVIDLFKSKPYYATQVTDDMAIAIDNYVRNVHAVPESKDGKFVGYNTKQSAENAMWVLFGKQIVKDAVSEAISNEKVSGFIKRSRPSTGSEPNNRTQGDMSKEDKVRLATQEWLQPRSNKPIITPPQKLN